MDQMKSWLSKTADVKKNFEELKQAAERATEHIIKLIVIFLLQTLVLPLLLLWALYGVAKRAFEWPGQRPYARYQRQAREKSTHPERVQRSFMRVWKP